MSTQENQLRTIRLYGVMGRTLGRVHKRKLEIGSPAEAVQAMMHTVPGFSRFLTRSRDMGLAFTVFAGKRNLGEGDLRTPVEADEDIRIAPVLRGRKQGVFQVILGAVLIVVGLYIGVQSGGTAGAIAQGLVATGIGMIAGGVVQMLTPLPRTTKSSDKPGQQANTSFNGPVNTVAQGNSVPVFYGGPMPVGSVVASAGIRVKESDYTPTPTVGSVGFMGGGGGSGFNGVARLA
jgi:predicted phage tail protein